MGGFFFCSVHVFQTSPNARASFAKQKSASAMMLTSRLRVEVWRCSNANHADTLVPHGNWRERSTRPELRRFLRWVFFQVDMIYDHDLHTFFSRFQIQSNEKFGSAIATSCHMHVRDSNFTKSEVLGNTKIGTNYGKAGFTQSEFELHALFEVPGTPKMVLSHIKYGKVGCDREITPRLGVCDRDITTLSAHALIGHRLGNSHVTCQKHDSAS